MNQRGQAKAQTAPSDSNVHLNGVSYTALFTINGMPLEGTLERADASAGWKMHIQGSLSDSFTLDAYGISLPRQWDVDLALEKAGLTADPNGLYTGRASISLTYDLDPLKYATYDLIRELRGQGKDFDASRISGWYSHVETNLCTLAQRWESRDFNLYISGLTDAENAVARALGHTLSYLPAQPRALFSQTLYYDMPKYGERCVYSLRTDAAREVSQARLTAYLGEKKMSLPGEPILEIDLHPALDALTYSDICLTLTPNEA